MAWVKIKQNENYSINEKGEVRNDIKGTLLKPHINKRSGYKMVSLWHNNKEKHCTIHRLLAEAFIPNPQNKPTVDHKDGNRLNNSLDNLRWATYGEQNSRFNTIGVRSQKVKVTHYEETRNSSGWGHKSWDRIDRTLYFDRIGDVAAYFGVSIGNISLMLKNGTIGKRGKMRGYKFEYAESQRKTFAKALTTIESTEKSESE